MSNSIRRILHPTDFTDESERAFRRACEIARDHCAELIVLHVISPADDKKRIINLRDFDRNSPEHQNLQHQFGKLKDCAEDVCIRYEVEVGCPAEAIAEFAKRENCGLIVLAAHTHCCLHRQFRGSISEKLTRLTPCPIVRIGNPLHVDRSRREIVFS